MTLYERLRPNIALFDMDLGAARFLPPNPPLFHPVMLLKKCS